MMNRLVNVFLIALLLLLAACGSAPPRPQTPKPAATSTSTPVTTVAGQPAPVMPKAGSGRGGYYKDDGPGDNPPPGLELTLDAEPKVEPYSVSGNKPYVVFGKTYTPILDDQPFSQRGIGSWYGKKFHNQKTSSGELYDMYKMTAAHPTLPIPSYARITNISNGKQVIVKINDRGPFHTNRIVDLSYTAALKLDYLGKGSSELLLERLLPADIEKMAESRKSKPAVPSALAVTAPAAAPAVETGAGVVTLPVATAATVVVPLVSSAAPDSAGLDALIAAQATAERQPALPAAVPAAASDANPGTGLYLQFGAFGLRSNADATFALIQSRLTPLPALEIVQQGTLYRLFSGPFASRDEANELVQLAIKIGLPKPIIVPR